MDAEALEAATRHKMEFDRNRELSRSLRCTHEHPLDCRPDREDLFLVASETEEYLRAVGDADLADRIQREVHAAVDTALAMQSYRLRLALLRHGVHV